MSLDMASNEVRIISGLWKGRKLRFSAAKDLRPSLGRVRETLFNWLVADIEGAHCLDLFAGSGALGFEALSRGAASVVLVEKDRRIAQSLRENRQLLGADNASVVNAPAERFLRQPPAEPWDIVFFDPPFSDPDALKLLETLQQEGYLTPGGLIYIEQPRHRPLPDSMRLLKQAKAGDCHFALLRGG